MKNAICAVVLALSVFCAAAVSQTQKEDSSKGEWKGFVFEQTTPEDAVRVLGAPLKDETNQKLSYTFNRAEAWIDKRVTAQNIFRRMRFAKTAEKIEPVLYFRNDKLVSIEFRDPGELNAPNDLPQYFNAEFKAHITKSEWTNKSIELPPVKVFASSQTPVKGKCCKLVYYNFIAVRKASFIFAGIDNEEPSSQEADLASYEVSKAAGDKSPKGDERRATAILNSNYQQEALQRQINAQDERNKRQSLPGLVIRIQIFSRSLEKN